MPRKILIIDDYDDLASALGEEFTQLGHDVVITQNRSDAVKLSEGSDFDMVITDLDGRHLVAEPGNNGQGELECLPKPIEKSRSNVKAFKICLKHFRRDDFKEEELIGLVKTTLNYKSKHIDRGPAMKNRREKIDFEVPSVISLMDDILEYLMARVEKLGVIKPQRSNLFVALDEAFVNAVKHGNKFDTSKLVRVSVEISPKKASFTIEDEGEGFNVAEIPDPRDPENLFKTSGRGVMFIYNIMDEVKYNKRGNRLTMVKLTEKGD
ncbi:MAG TPA: ATP-binding protein [Aridibacter sp.]|nr:ATP-binding protein [Aridibacter sp.]